MDHIERSLPRITGYLGYVFPTRAHEVILVDDGSTDGTREFLSRLRPSDSLRVEFNEKNLGRGGAVKRGLRLARGRITGFMDIDREVSESYIPRFVEEIERGSDLVVASRSYNVSANPWVLSRHLASTGYRKLVNAVIGLPVADSEAGYKFFSPQAREAILELSRFDNWFWDTEVVKICELAGFSISEIPVLFLRDLTKTSTVHLARDTKLYLESIRRYRRLEREGAYVPRAVRRAA
jgi:dolichyl-phosphate beta-glucosyltransferase